MSGLSGFLELEEESLEEVISTMRELQNYIRENEDDSLLPFLQAYLRITEEVRDARKANLFENPEDLEKLDVRFARLYFSAIEDYIENGVKQKPWMEYFTYIEREDSKPVVELVLGINSHINSDLAQALHETDYRNKQDFRKIDRILRKSLFPVLKQVALDRKDLETAGFAAMPPAGLIGLNRITDWREHTYQNSKPQVFRLEKVQELTERNAEKIIELRHNQKPSNIIKKPFKAAKTQVKL